MTLPPAETSNVRALGLEPGEVLAGKYRIERVIGRGGMGMVVEAHHLHLDERVAIKFLLPHVVVNQEVVARFLREARAAIKIKGQHVARVTDVGMLASGAPYMVMEYLEGQDLAAMVAERGALPIAEAVELVVQACDAIAEAHVLGIVHRDLKPANLFCVRGPDGLPAIKVLDFGISKVPTNDHFDVTRTAALLGSPLYMSPEQITSAKTVDSRADIWALGVVLYELLAGRPPFVGETLPELSVRIAMQPPPPLRNYRPDLPDGLESIVFRCLEKDRDRRFRNVAELAAALAQYAPTRVGVLAERISRIIYASGLSPAASNQQVSLDSSGGTVSAWGNTDALSGSYNHRGRIAALAIGGVALIGLGVTVFALSREAAPGSAEPAAAASHPEAAQLERAPGSAVELKPTPAPEAGFADSGAAPALASSRHTPSAKHFASKRSAVRVKPSHRATAKRPAKPAPPTPTEGLGGRL